MLAATHWAIGGDPAEPERLILASDQSRLQAGIALSAATRTAWPPKVIALGRALAAGLVAADEARILTEPFIMAALADVEAPPLMNDLFGPPFIGSPERERWEADLRDGSSGHGH